MSLRISPIRGTSRVMYRQKPVNSGMRPKYSAADTEQETNLYDDLFAGLSRGDLRQTYKAVDALVSVKDPQIYDVGKGLLNAYKTKSLEDARLSESEAVALGLTGAILLAYSNSLDDESVNAALDLTESVFGSDVDKDSKYVAALVRDKMYSLKRAPISQANGLMRQEWKNPSIDDYVQKYHGK